MTDKEIDDAKMLDAAKRVVALAGGNAVVRRLLAKEGMPISRSAITQWKRVPSNKVEILNKASGYRVSCNEMRPFIFRNKV